MPAAIAELELENGVYRLHCPTCGTVILDMESGITEDPCKHVLFYYLDLVGELETPHIGQYPSDLHSQIEEILYDGTEAAMAGLAALFPSSVLILQLREPARGGGHDGSTLLMALDLTSTAEDLD